MQKFIGGDSPEVMDQVKKDILNYKNKREEKIEEALKLLQNEYIFVILLDRLNKLDPMPESLINTSRKLVKLIENQYTTPEMADFIISIVHFISSGRYNKASVILSENIDKINALDFQDEELLKLIERCRELAIYISDEEPIDESIRSISTRLWKKILETQTLMFGKAMNKDFNNAIFGEM